jgi:hypothetical protein
MFTVSGPECALQLNKKMMVLIIIAMHEFCNSSGEVSWGKVFLVNHYFVQRVSQLLHIVVKSVLDNLFQ